MHSYNTAKQYTCTASTIVGLRIGSFEWIWSQYIIIVKPTVCSTTMGMREERGDSECRVRRQPEAAATATLETLQKDRGSVIDVYLRVWWLLFL